MEFLTSLLINGPAREHEGFCGMESQPISCRNLVPVKVVEIQYVEHALSMQTYLARREELKAQFQLCFGDEAKR